MGTNVGVLVGAADAGILVGDDVTGANEFPGVIDGMNVGLVVGTDVKPGAIVGFATGLAVGPGGPVGRSVRATQYG